MKRSRTPVWGLVVLAVLTVAACAPAGGVRPTAPGETLATTPSTNPESTVVPEIPDRGTVVIGIGTSGPPRTLNPLLDGPDTEVLDLIGHAVLARGYVVDPATMDPVPVLLDAIPSLANGGIVERADGTIDVTVRVIAGALWADGTPITADDLLFTYELAVDPDIPFRGDLRARYEQILPGSAQADGLTLRFRMRRSIDAELLFDVIVPRNDVDAAGFGSAWTDTMWVAGGPFEFASYVPGQYLELTRNERFPAPGTAGVERVVFRFYRGDLGVDPRLFRAFETRALDVVVIPEAHLEADAYRELESEGARVTTAPGLVWEHINFQFGGANRNAQSLNRHLAFRRAVAHAIDRDALADGRGTVSLSSALGLYRPGLTSSPWAVYEFDQEQVDGLLFELGEELGEDLFLGDGPDVVITTSSDSPASVAMAGDIVVMLSEAGFAAELQLEGPALFFGRTLDNGTWDLATWRFTATAGRAAAIDFVSLFDPDGLPFAGNNFFRWGTVQSTVRNEATERYATLIDELSVAVDPVEIDDLLVRAENALAANVVLVPLIVHEDVGVAWWGDEVEGIVLNPAAGIAWNVGEWRPAAPPD